MSGQLHIMSLCCKLSSEQVVQGVTNNSTLIVINHDVFLYFVCYTEPGSTVVDQILLPCEGAGVRDYIVGGFK